MPVDGSETNVVQDNARRKEKLVKEIITSEKSYLRHLDTLIQHFVEPLELNKLLTVKEANSIFGEIRAIRQVNQELLKCFTSEPTSMGKAFAELSPFLKLYSVYANNYEAASAQLQKLEKIQPKLAEFRQKQESRPEVQMKLQSLLIMPVQRIPRYKLLLEELLQLTLSDSREFCVIQVALQQVSEVASHINSQLTQWENVQRMLALQRSLVGGQPKIVVPGRLLVKEGVLMKLSRKTKAYHERRFFLFNDMLMYCKVRRFDVLHEAPLFSCSCILPIKHCKAEPLGGDGKRQRVYFKIICQEESFVVYCDNFATGQAWIEAINTTAFTFVEQRKTLRKQSTARRPLRRAAILKQKSELDLATAIKRKRDSSLIPTSQVTHTLTPLKQKHIKADMLDSGDISASKKLRLRHRVLGMMTMTLANSSPRRLFKSSSEHSIPCSPTPTHPSGLQVGERGHCTAYTFAHDIAAASPKENCHDLQISKTNKEIGQTSFISKLIPFRSLSVSSNSVSQSSSIDRSRRSSWPECGIM